MRDVVEVMVKAVVLAAEMRKTNSKRKCDDTEDDDELEQMRGILLCLLSGCFVLQACVVQKGEECKKKRMGLEITITQNNTKARRMMKVIDDHYDDVG